MSEGDPHKRQKTSEEPQALMTEESTLKHQNLCLSVTLKEQREEIKKLRMKGDELTQKSRNQEVFLIEFNLKWAKIISDLNTLCAELSVKPAEPSPFDVFIQDPGGLEEFIEVTRKCVQKLLETIKKVSDYEAGSILENCKEQLDVSSIRSENMRLKHDLICMKDENVRMRAEIDDISMKKTNLEIKLMKKGESSFENSSDKADDLGEVKRQRDAYEKMYKNEVLEKKKKKYVNEVTFESFVNSRTFRGIVSSAVKINEKLKGYREKYNDLYEYRINFKEKLKKEIRYIEEKETKKREELEKKVEKICKDMVEVKTSRDDALRALEVQKKLQKDLKSSNNFSVLIDTLESDKSKLKEKNSKLKEKLQNLNKTIETLEDIQKSNASEPSDQKLLRLLEETRSKLKLEQQNSDNLIKEVEVTENAYEKQVEKVKMLTKQLTDQEEIYHKLMSEKVKEASWRIVHDQETQAFEEKISEMTERIHFHEELQSQFDEILKKKDEQIEALANKCKDFEKKIKIIYEKHEEGLLRVSELLEYKKDYVSALKKADKLFTKAQEETSNNQKRLEIEIKRLEKELSAKNNLNNLKSTDEILNQEVSYYKQLIRCSVCNDRKKDTILRGCLHVFCNLCLASHLETRKRKCPICKNRFNKEDMKNFIWEKE